MCNEVLINVIFFTDISPPTLIDTNLLKYGGYCYYPLYRRHTTGNVKWLCCTQKCEASIIFDEQFNVLGECRYSFPPSHNHEPIFVEKQATFDPSTNLVYYEGYSYYEKYTTKVLATTLWLCRLTDCPAFIRLNENHKILKEPTLHNHQPNFDGIADPGPKCMKLKKSPKLKNRKRIVKSKSRLKSRIVQEKPVITELNPPTKESNSDSEPKREEIEFRDSPTEADDTESVDCLAVGMDWSTLFS